MNYSNYYAQSQSPNSGYGGYGANTTYGPRPFTPGKKPQYDPLIPLSQQPWINGGGIGGGPGGMAGGTSGGNYGSQPVGQQPPPQPTYAGWQSPTMQNAQQQGQAFTGAMEAAGVSMQPLPYGQRQTTAGRYGVPGATMHRMGGATGGATGMGGDQLQYDPRGSQAGVGAHSRGAVTPASASRPGRVRRTAATLPAPGQLTPQTAAQFNQNKYKSWEQMPAAQQNAYTQFMQQQRRLQYQTPQSNMVYR